MLCFLLPGAMCCEGLWEAKSLPQAPGRQGFPAPSSITWLFQEPGRSGIIH